MAIRDLLYACIECGHEAAIKADRRAESCRHCGTRYRRVNGAQIMVLRPTGATEVKSAFEWLELLESRRLPRVEATLRERVSIRQAETSMPMRHRGTYLGQVEKFGPTVTGWLTLDQDVLRFEPDSGTSQRWLLAELTAVQPSSRTLQLKVRHGPVLSIRFLDASPLLWEERVRNAVQAVYASTGRGEIREFQPRIVCR